jgi:hypothetical protein
MDVAGRHVDDLGDDAHGLGVDVDLIAALVSTF